jgi:hypothetical protein
LQQSFAIAQIDEDDAAVIASPLRPAGYRDHLADQRRADPTTIMSTHQVCHLEGKARDAKACTTRGQVRGVARATV